jgi:hypothetical protein
MESRTNGAKAPERLAIGSFVMLKSSSPVMTVLADVGHGADRMIRAGWFFKDAEYHEARFPFAALVAISSETVAQAVAAGQAAGAQAKPDA